MDEQALTSKVDIQTGLIPSLAAGASLPAIVRGKSGAEVCALIAELRYELEIMLEREPANYDGLVLLGELNLRVGLSREAQELLYRASLLQPPNWEAFQRTSLLLRRAEEQRAKSFDRVAGAAPPLFARQLTSKATAKLTPMWRRLAVRGTSEVCS